MSFVKSAAIAIIETDSRLISRDLHKSVNQVVQAKKATTYFHHTNKHCQMTQLFVQIFSIVCGGPSHKLRPSYTASKNQTLPSHISSRVTELLTSSLAVAARIPLEGLSW